MKGKASKLDLLAVFYVKKNCVMLMQVGEGACGESGS
jgi:hypothetical protein